MTAARNQPLKQGQPKRDWSRAIKKRNSEGYCRVCGHPDGGYINGVRAYRECAYIIGREHDAVVVGPRGGESFVVLPESIVPLCGSTPERRGCHQAFDARNLDLLPYLTVEEQARAVLEADGIVAAYRRLTGGR